MSNTGANPTGAAAPAAAATATNVTNELRRTISPYDLTSADNPGAVISHPLLKGINYDEWACGLKTALTSRKKFGFLDGSIAKPDDGSSDLDDWWTIQALLVSWIRMTIDPVLRSTISHRDVAQDLWEHLKKRFSVMNGSRIQQIKAELACCKQRGIAIEAYYGKLTRIWDSLASYRPLRTCKCGLCTCDLGTAQEADREEDKVHQFLFGLDDQFRAVRSSLVARVPVQSLEEVYNIVRQEEDLRVVGEERPEVTSFAVQTKSRYLNNEKEKGMLCKHCNRSGHTSDSCFAVIGYPEWWGERPKGRTLQGRGRGASSGGGRGRGQPAYANRVYVPNVENQSHEQVNHVLTDEDRDGVNGLSEQQWRMIKNILNAGKENNTEKVSGKSSLPSWIMDTGASHHLTGRFDALLNVRDMPPVLIIMADGREKVSLKEGSIRLGSDLIMKSVYFVDGLKSDLVSVGQLMDENRCVVQMADRFLVVQDRNSRMVTGAGERVGGTFHFRSTEIAAAVTTREEGAIELWHSRMGHPSAKVLGKLPCISDSVSSTSLNKCDVCFRAKQTRDCFPVSMNKTSMIFELIHVDIWGPYRTPSHSGARYFLTIVDDFSRGVWLYLMTDKSEAPSLLKKFFALTERQFDKKVKSVRSDNGTEFLCLSKFFQENGVLHETSCVGTPQQNGRVERKHRHILNVARALRFQANLPIAFWGECVLTAGYLINRTPSSVLGYATPFERLFNKAPSYDHLKIFGSLCYAHNQHRGGDKFASRSRRCVFVGYPHGKKGWRVYDLEKSEFFVSRDVVFVESKFPYSPTTSLPLVDEEEEGQALWAPISEGILVDEELGRHIGPSVPRREETETTIGPSQPNIEAQETEVESEPTRDSSSSDQISSSSSPPEREAVTEIADPPLGRGHRKKTKAVTLKNFVVNSIDSKPGFDLGTTTLYPLSDQDNVHRFSEQHIAYVAAVITNVEPKSFKEAMKDKKWKDAVGKEYGALMESGTWTIEDLPPGLDMEETTVELAIIETVEQSEGFYMDEEAMFGMPMLLANMAEGMLLPLPSVQWTHSCDVEGDADEPLWSY